MKIVVDGAIREKYPDLRIGVVVARNVVNTAYDSQLEEYCKNIFSSFARKFESPKDIEVKKNIIAWQDIYRSFGINPKKKKPTAESLLARAIRNNYIPHINPAVDAYLCAETLQYLPIGGYDLSKISGDITLKYADGGEEFLGVGAESVEYTDKGEVIYRDDARVLTRCWNYRDCDFSKIDVSTNTLALFSEAPISDITDDEVNETIECISSNLQKFCGASCTTMFMTKEQNVLTII
ncbi:MAG: hypothetical protein LBU51_00770 [Bacteroidales bacterium]|jgi:DNA/RNA-binding domain of Phe-tRNA-synthetase-like protein|nr:hypothetical protein [Bacteroidales bacterium]